MKSTNKLFLTLLLAAIGYIGNVSAQQADSVKRLIDTVLAFGKKNSLYRDQVNWKKVEDSVRFSAATATTFKQVLPAIQLFYQLLGDYHGFMTYDKKYYGWRRNEQPLSKTTHAALIKKMKDGYQLKKQMLAKRYGYLLVPDNNPTHPGDVNKIARQIRDSLAALDLRKIKGLVIDLRLNPGGDMFAMIGGLTNLFESGKLGSFVYPGTGKEETWGIASRNGVDRVYSGTDTACTVTRRGKSLADVKIVVLIGPNTGSSGEALAISFKGRKNTWFIGENTSGYTTANDSFQFTNKIGVFMASSVEADRNGKVYLDHVKPDQQIIGGDDFDQPKNDIKVIAALKWLKNK